MKKHEMVLDFTSLLDVILIILFLVLGTMNGKAQKDAANIEELENKNSSLEAVVEQQGTQIKDLTDKNEQLSQNVAELEGLIKDLQSQVDSLEKGLSEADKLNERYEALIEKYEELSKLNENEMAAFEAFLNKTVLTLKIEEYEDGFEKKITEFRLYSSDNQLGTSCTVEPDKNLYSSNEQKVEQWLRNLLNKKASESNYKEITIVINYDENNISHQADLIKDNVVKNIKEDTTKGYNLSDTVEVKK